MNIVIDNWYEMNRRCLDASLADVRARLERRAAVVRGESAAIETSSEPAGTDETTDAGILPNTSIGRLSIAFNLTPFERDIVLMCAGAELDDRFAAICAAAHGDNERAFPTFGLALSALREPHWSAFAPISTLRHWLLIELGRGDGLTNRPIQIDERILHFVVGIQYLDARFGGTIEPAPTPVPLARSQVAIAHRLVATWKQSAEVGTVPIVQLSSNDFGEARAVAAYACAELGIQLHTVRTTDLPQDPVHRDQLTRLWEREAVLNPSALLVDCSDADQSLSHVWRSFVETVPGFLITVGGTPFQIRSRPCIRIDMSRPSATEQIELWQESLGRHAISLNGRLDSIANQFQLSATLIRSVSGDALNQLATDSVGDLGALLWQSCRAAARTGLDELAQRIDSSAVWDDLVLPETPVQLLRTIAAHVRRRNQVYVRWGFGHKASRGLGISALFSGPSGTGKTLAAEVLANELDLDLYRIDLSTVVSKYIGETEKNLRRVFDAAERGGAILLFDEADALFGRRSEVKDSHDRYANIEVSYLLQRMESYRGLAILTSNMKNAIDSAFLRRIRFVVHFPFPDAAHRCEIWRRAFPRATPTDGLVWEKLARLNLSGGNIQNVAVNAAFLAADTGESVRMAHLLMAARGEYGKLEKPLSEVEIGGWL